eukprot:2520685-Pyramimonas_sp.AAC.1
MLWLEWNTSRSQSCSHTVVLRKQRIPHQVQALPNHSRTYQVSLVSPNLGLRKRAVNSLHYIVHARALPTQTY